MDTGAVAAGPTRRTMMATAGLALLTEPGTVSASAMGAADTAPAPLVIDSDRTIEESLVLTAATRIVVAKGATLTLLGDLLAPATRIFFGEGRVDLNQSRVLAARPEWWGAAPNDGAVDSHPAIAAALAAHPATQLGPGDYHLFDVLHVGQADRRLWGIGRAGGGGTRLVGHRRDGPVILAGTAEAPASVNDYVRGIDVRWIELARSVAARVTTGDDQLAPAGLAIRHVLDCTFEGLRSNEHAIGYSIRGAVRTFLRDCTAFRSIFTDPTRDIFIGFDMDGRRPPIPTGANASIYLIDCNARTGNRPTLPLSIGCRLLGTFSDTFLTRFETTELANGIVIDGSGVDIARHPFGQCDVHIDSPVLDQCSQTCIVITGLTDRAMIDIRSPWLSPVGQGGTALRMTDGGGATTIVGGQFVAPSTPAGCGMVLTRASGVAMTATKMMGFASAIQASDSDSLDLTVTIVAAQLPCHTAITLDRCRNSYLRPHLLGAVQRACVGVVADACSDVTIDTMGLGSASMRIDGQALPASDRRATGFRTVV